MPDLSDKLSELIQRYERDRTAPRTEADVSANFIDYLFAALGWDITNPNEYNRQRYVREAGFATSGCYCAENLSCLSKSNASV